MTKEKIEQTNVDESQIAAMKKGGSQDITETTVTTGGGIDKRPTNGASANQ